MQQVSPIEDLMREHGVLSRILLIYKNIIYRINSNSYYNIAEDIYALAWEATNIVKQFIEEYHQVLERDYVFPVLSQYEQYRELIEILLIQHEAAKCTTDEILVIFESGQRNNDTHKQLSRLLLEFVQMYEPHSAREDTVVFPAFHQLTPTDKFNEMGEKFESIEEQKFGERGFEKIVGQISQIEKALNIYELNQFTMECKYQVNMLQGQNHTLRDLLKDGGYILYSRHGEANIGEDSPNLNFNDCNTQRNLSKKGRMEAIEYGDRLRSLQVSINYPIIASPFCRTIETAALAFGKQNVMIDPFWYDVYRLSGNLSLYEQNRILKNMQSRLEKIPPKGMNTVIIAHGLPNGIGFGAIDDMGTVIIRPLGIGKGYEIVDKLRLQDLT